MKKFIALITLVLSFSAAADSIKIFEEKLANNEDIRSMDFDVNKSMNRAWVNITTATYDGESSNYSDLRVKVEGLSYDPTINGVVYNSESGEQIVCGTFYNRRFTIDFGMSFKATGRCKFSQKTVKVIEDNGFETYQRTVTQAFLTIE